MSRLLSQRSVVFVFFLIISLSYVLCVSPTEEIVTCGSVVKLRHKPTGFRYSYAHFDVNNSDLLYYFNRLHSHAVNWGSGSGQQSVTAFNGGSDVNSYFQVKGPHNGVACVQGLVSLLNW